MSGFVTLLGAGPGNIELLTLLGKRRLEHADVVIYDHLVNPDLLSYAPANADFLYVGKKPYQKHISQDEINDLMRVQAEAGKKVVRLKAGDPFVFGRGGEEGQYLREHHVEFEVVPGLTSAITGLAAAGIPITHRDYASSFHILTAHQTRSQPLNWDSIAQMEGTLVFLMGVAELHTIVTELLKRGKTATTPVAIIQWATQWRQNTGIGTLSDIEAIVKRQHISSPALIVIGGVVNLSQQLSSHRALERKHILMPFSVYGRTHDLLADAGASIDFFNLGDQQSHDVDLPDFNQAGRLVITNLRAFEYFQQQMLQVGLDQRALSGWQLLVTNNLIKERLQQRGVLVDHVIDLANLNATDWIVGEQNDLSMLSFEGSNVDRQLITYTDVFKRQSISSPDTFDAVVVTSKRACLALVHGLESDQLKQIKTVPAFTLGDKLATFLSDNGFQSVTNVGSLAQMVSRVKEVIKND